MGGWHDGERKFLSLTSQGVYLFIRMCQLVPFQLLLCNAFQGVVYLLRCFIHAVDLMCSCSFRWHHSNGVLVLVFLLRLKGKFFLVQHITVYLIK